MKITDESIKELNFHKYVKKPIPVDATKMEEDFEVKTLEGMMRGNKGDYLIVGVEGEPYPCKGEVFEETYEELK